VYYFPRRFILKHYKRHMKKYGMISAVVVVVAGTTLLLVFNMDNKEKVVGTSQITASQGEIQVDPIANKANRKVGENGTPTSKKGEETQQAKKQEEILEEIQKMVDPEWDKVNQVADKRLSELMTQAQEEYKAKKERNLDISRINGKYQAIYNDYEEDTKTMVDKIISNIQKEVVKNNLNSNIGNEYLQLYRIEKEKRIEKVSNELKKLS
jgi:membrane protein involved in colicin uptake